MKREQRISTYRRTLDAGEREASMRLQEVAARLGEAQIRLEQLERYRNDYIAHFDQRATGGISAPVLLDFQAFLARLGEAIHQQAALVVRIEGERQHAEQRLRDAAVKNRSVGAVVERWRAEDRLVEGRREQLATDEAARQVLQFAAANN